jgi:hypothetical protein
LQNHNDSTTAGLLCSTKKMHLYFLLTSLAKIKTKFPKDLYWTELRGFSSCSSAHCSGTTTYGQTSSETGVSSCYVHFSARNQSTTARKQVIPRAGMILSCIDEHPQWVKQCTPSEQNSSSLTNTSLATVVAMELLCAQ